MKNNPKFEEWHNIIGISEKTFASPIIKNAAQYLRNNRNHEGDWGYYKGLPIDIHVSSLAIEALRICKSIHFETSAEDAASCIKTNLINNLDTFGVQQLVDSLNILSSTDPRDSELELKVVERLKELRRDVGWGEPSPSLSLSCGVILAFMKLENPPQGIIRQWVNYLVQQQHSDGGWGATIDSESAIIPTCWAIRVLSLFSDKSLAKTLSTSIEFIRNYFQTKSWNELGDTFTISTVLRTLGEIEEFPFEIVKAGIDSLYERVNTDGGWGAVKDETSNIEHTALSMIALSSAGENKFVHARLAKSTLETAESEIMKLRDERAKFLEDINQRVKKEISNIIQERNDLQKKVNSYKEEKSRWENKVKGLEAEVKDLEKIVSGQRDELEATKTRSKLTMPDLEYRTRILWATDYRFVIIVALLTAMVSIGAYFFLGSNPMLFLTVVIVLVLSLSGYFFVLWRKQRISRLSYDLQFGTETNYLSYELISLLAEWPPSKREDFLFRLAKEMEHIKSKDFDDYAGYISEKYAERASQSRRIRDIIYVFMGLPISARLNVIDRVRGKVSSYEGR